MILGVTATRKGASGAQKILFDELVRPAFRLGPVEFHHGDCVGGDAEAHDIMRAIGECTIISHPPNKDEGRAFKEADIILPPKSHLARDWDIATAAQVMFAMPYQKHELRRGSGTWATIRYSRKLSRPLIIIHRDGSLIRERWTGWPTG